MKSIIIGLITFSTVAHARPLNCIVSFMEGGSVQDFVMPWVSTSSSGDNSYALSDKNGFSFSAKESVSADVISLMIVDKEKTHLGSAPFLRKGQRACITVDLGRNANNDSVKVAISCEAL